MIQIFPEELKIQLNKKLYSYYILLGSDPLLVQESLHSIRLHAENLNFKEYLSVSLNIKTNLNLIFNLCKEFNLFDTRRILFLIIPDDELTVSYSNEIWKQLFLLLSIQNDRLMFILQGNRLLRSLNSKGFLSPLKKNMVIVNCMTPKDTKFILWVKHRAQNMNISLDESSCKALCSYYEGNLSALVQVLNQLLFMYPDGNFNLSKIKDTITDCSCFLLFHWMNAILSGDIKRSNRILNKLKKNYDSIILLRFIEKEVLRMLMFKRKIIQLNKIFNENKIFKQEQKILFKKFLDRISIQQLNKSVELIAKIELKLKTETEYSSSIWRDFKALTMLLCGKSIPIFMFID